MFYFFDLYLDFHHFYNSFFKGNEIEFIYKSKRYYIVPHYDDNDEIIGVELGEANSTVNTICLSTSGLYNAAIGDTVFGEALSNIEIVHYNC